MEAIEMITGRRSVRKYLDKAVDRALMTEIMEATRYAQSWANMQVARYTLVDDAAIIERLGKEGVNGFVYNVATLQNAKNVCVLSFVKGKSGKLPEQADYATSKAQAWEVFDAGIACQTFCLAAHAKGIGTCVMGIIDDAAIADIVGLPEGETVAALIVYGYPDEAPAATPRMSVAEICRFC